MPNDDAAPAGKFSPLRLSCDSVLLHVGLMTACGHAMHMMIPTGTCASLIVLLLASVNAAGHLKHFNVHQCLWSPRNLPIPCMGMFPNILLAKICIAAEECTQNPTPCSLLVDVLPTVQMSWYDIHS